jgi:hypothetical protein
VTDELRGPGERVDATFVEVEASTWRAQPDSLTFDQRVSAEGKVLWAALCSYGESPERCFPGVETLARRLGVSDRTIQRKLAELQATGWIEVVPRFTEGRQRSNGYLVRRHLTSVSSRGDTAVTLGGDSAVTLPGDTAVTRMKASKNESKRNEKSLVASAPSDSSLVKLDDRKALTLARDKVSRELLNRWWEGENPRPAQPYIACLKVVSKMIEVGWTPDDVFFALTEAPVVSTGALTMALKMRRKVSAGTQTQTLLAMMTKLDGMSVEDQEVWWNTEGPGRLKHG